jgi:hypothetical protein
MLINIFNIIVYKFFNKNNSILCVKMKYLFKKYFFLSDLEISFFHFLIDTIFYSLEKYTFTKLQFIKK